MDELLNKLSQWRPFTAIVVGDFMLDQTIVGDAERLTGDAPVPVLHVRETHHMPGGAANVCLNLAAMGAKVLAFGVVGDDADGRILREALEADGVDCAGLLVDPSRPTTVKRSLVGRAQHRHPQKMFRMDQESTEPLSSSIASDLIERFSAAAGSADIITIEDYSKGVCAGDTCKSVVEMSRDAGVELIVDPARDADFSRYQGATAITPNRTEAEQATGLPACDNATIEINGTLARAVRDAAGVETVILTLDRHGALLLGADDQPIAVPTVARQVYDVTGAGDMVLAALAAGRAQGMSWRDSVRLANSAAGLEVEVFGVKPIAIERIHQQVMCETKRLSGKLRTLEEAKVEVAAAKGDGRRVVFTNGCFDIIHAGHIRLLQEARKFGDLLIVGLNTDESITRLKGEGRPVHAQHDRISVMSELESVGIVVLFDADTPMELLEALRPDVLVKGGDYTKDQVVGNELVESYGGTIELIAPLEGRSTSEAIARLKLA